MRPAAGAACTISVTFIPTGTGNESATLTLTYSDAVSAVSYTQSVALTGTGSGFSLAAASSTQTVSPGQTAAYTLNVTPGGGFSQAIQLTCAGAPAQSTCSVSPSSFTLNGSTFQTATVTVTTMSTSSGVIVLGFGPHPGAPYGVWIWWLGILGLASLLGRARRERRRSWGYGLVLTCPQLSFT